MVWQNVTMAQYLLISRLQEDVLSIYLMIYHVLWEIIALIQYTTALIARILISFAQNQRLVLNMIRLVMEFAIV